MLQTQSWHAEVHSPSKAGDPLTELAQQMHVLMRDNHRLMLAVVLPLLLMRSVEFGDAPSNGSASCVLCLCFCCDPGLRTVLARRTPEKCGPPGAVFELLGEYPSGGDKFLRTRYIAPGKAQKLNRDVNA